MTLSLFRMDAQQIRRDVSHYTLTHTHLSVSPACRILVQKQDITKYIYIYFSDFLTCGQRVLGHGHIVLKERLGHCPLSSPPCPCASSLWLLVDWSSKTDDFILRTQVL